MLFATLAISVLTSDSIEAAKLEARSEVGLGADPAPGSMSVRIAPTASGIFGVGLRYDTSDRVSFHLWRADDDGGWRVADKHGALGFPYDVVANRDRIVVAGTDGSAALWSAPVDGGSWERVVARQQNQRWSDIHTLETIPNAALTSVAAGPAGLFVAVGQVDEPNGRLSPVAVSSPDGRRWRTVDLPVPTDGQTGRFVRMARVIATPDGFLAIGQGGFNGSVPLMWRSPDGVAWEPLAPTFEGAAPARRPYLQIVSAGPAGLLAVGTDGADRPRRVVWASSHGDHWTVVPTTGPELPVGFITDLVLADGVWVAIAPSAGNAASAYLLAASPDGHRWEALAIPGFKPDRSWAWGGAAVADGHLFLVRSKSDGAKVAPVLVKTDLPLPD